MNILIVRLGALGDVVHAIPAAAALRRAFPAARIDWIVERRHREIVDLVGLIDRVLVLEGSSIGAWRSAVAKLRQTDYDVALDLQGLMKSAVLARASGAARVIGFSIWHLREKGARPFYSTTVEAEGGHVVRKNLRLLSSIGVNSDTIEFPIAPVETPVVSAVRDLVGGAFALINPGGAWPNKRWPPERFGELASFIRDACGLTPVILWGPGEDALAETVRGASGGSAVVAPSTSVTDLVGLARAAALMVSGDTGPLHIATAVGTPTVGLFGPTDPERNGPWSPEDVTVSRFEQCGCHYDRRCHQQEWCLLDVSVPEVCAAVKQRLAARTLRG
jgi:lipopolysaccharide heptosyltransferase I